MANEHEPKSPPSKQGDLLSSFLASVDSFTKKISALAAAAAPEGNQRLIIQSTGQSFENQMGKLIAHVQKVAALLHRGSAASSISLCRSRMARRSLTARRR